jgi:hypothetical protein
MRLQVEVALNGRTTIIYVPKRLWEAFINITHATASFQP